MDRETAIQIESSQKQHHEVLEHQDRMFVVCQSADYNLFSILKPQLKVDGNQWCVLYGDNLQEGIAGFGSTPEKAILDWNSQWVKEL